MSDQRHKTPDALARTEWIREGAGWLGRTVHGEFGEFTVEPAGGLHGGWKWSNPHCEGSGCQTDDLAKNYAEATYQAIEKLDEEIPF